MYEAGFICGKPLITYFDTLRVDGNHVWIHTVVGKLRCRFLVFCCLLAAVVGYHEWVTCVWVVVCR